MRKAALSLALFFAAVSSQAAIIYKNFSQPVSFQYFLPCANAGQGELITFSGTTQTTLAEALENGWIIAQFHIRAPHYGNRRDYWHYLSSGRLADIHCQAQPHQSGDWH